MKTLRHDWFYSDLIDIEYKKYVLLGYLKDVQNHFNQTRLYPQLADLVFHYRNLLSYTHHKQKLQNGFPQTISDIDLKNFKIAYQSAVSNDELMQTIEDIVNYSLPQIQKRLEEGKEIYEFVENLMCMDPVGILPMYRKEGYLIIKDGDDCYLKVYEYELKLFENNYENYRAVSTTYIDSYHKSFVNTTENIKIDLIKKRKKLPNPATFAIESQLNFPLEETLLQIAKRKLTRFLE